MARDKVLGERPMRTAKVESFSPVSLKNVDRASMRRNVPNRQIFVKHIFCLLGSGAFHQQMEICLMDKNYPNRIREIRKSKGLTIEELAEETGLSVSFTGRLEKGERRLSVHHMDLFAAALAVEPQDLLPTTNPRTSNVVAIMGRIGAGAEISPDEEQIPPEGLYEIETPFPLPEDALAFEVYGESMWPRYDDGDIIICWRQGVVVEEVLGWEAAVKTSTGQRYLKRVLRGSEKGTFDLESHNAPPIRGVQIVWVAAIQSVIRSGQWKKLTPAARQRLVQKMTASG
ncbi:XRE family transcriptional regulator [Agrobacterium sp. 22-209-1]